MIWFPKITLVGKTFQAIWIFKESFFASLRMTVIKDVVLGKAKDLPIG